ncbi:MAG: hypothetical protein DRJ18_00950 [Candidatus Methanomethylicota archaeon]|nr:MAG: hypothetical protein DRJ18_00950 [Candidatus Verstraetearchaeota archaeon]
MVELRRIVRLFEKVGAKCRKLRRRNVYECWKENVEATISEDGITIVSPGEFRIWYSEFRTYDGYDENEVLKRLKEITGAKDVDIEIPCDTLQLKLKFDLDKAEDAARVFNKMAEEDLWVAITNIEGELRLIRRGNQASTEEWLEGFK